MSTYEYGEIYRTYTSAKQGTEERVLCAISRVPLSTLFYGILSFIKWKVWSMLLPILGRIFMLDLRGWVTIQGGIAELCFRKLFLPRRRALWSKEGKPGEGMTIVWDQRPGSHPAVLDFALWTRFPYKKFIHFLVSYLSAPLLLPLAFESLEFGFQVNILFSGVIFQPDNFGHQICFI